jgi:hypothetical protein
MEKNIGNIWENMEHMENIIDIYIYGNIWGQIWKHILEYMIVYGH